MIKAMKRTISASQAYWILICLPDSVSTQQQAILKTDIPRKRKGNGCFYYNPWTKGLAFNWPSLPKFLLTFGSLFWLPGDPKFGSIEENFLLWLKLSRHWECKMLRAAAWVRFLRFEGFPLTNSLILGFKLCKTAHSQSEKVEPYIICLVSTLGSVSSVWASPAFLPPTKC